MTKQISLDHPTWTADEVNTHVGTLAPADVVLLSARNAEIKVLLAAVHAKLPGPPETPPPVSPSHSPRLPVPSCSYPLPAAYSLPPFVPHRSPPPTLSPPHCSDPPCSTPSPPRPWRRGWQALQPAPLPTLPHHPTSPPHLTSPPPHLTSSPHLPTSSPHLLTAPDRRRELTIWRLVSSPPPAKGDTGAEPTAVPNPPFLNNASSSTTTITTSSH